MNTKVTEPSFYRAPASRLWTTYIIPPLVCYSMSYETLMMINFFMPSLLFCFLPTGDIFLVESRRGYHLVQILDVMADVRSMAFIKSRRQPASAAQGEDDSSTAGDRTRELVYKLETMGCQMNMADSERIEGQLQSIGIHPARDEMEEKSANVVILNTCSIRDHAEQKVGQLQYEGTKQ